MNKTICRTIVAVALLVFMTGCGASELVKDTMDWVGGYFDKEDTLTRRVVVAPFSSGIKDLEPLAREIGSKVLADVNKVGNVRLVDPKKLAEIMHLIPPSVKRPRERMILAGRRLGLNTIVLGEVSDLSLKYDMSGIYGFRENTPFLRLEVDVTIIDVPTGTLLGRNSEVETLKVDDMTAENIRMQGKTPPLAMVNKLKHEIMDPTMDWIEDTLETQRWAGYVLEVQDKRIKVSVGKDTGLPEGSLLVIYAHGPRLVTGAGWPVFMPGPKVGTVQLGELGDTSSWAEIVSRAEPDSAEMDQPKKEKAGEKTKEDGAEAKEAKKEAEAEKKAPPAPKQARPDFAPGQLVRTR